MRKTFFSLLTLFASLNALAQKESIHEISVGNTIPDLTIKNIINYRVQSIKISEFKEKLLILDFWATWCSPCIASFSKQDSLQKKYSGDLMILPVTYEETEYVSKFLNKLNKIAHILPVSATADKILVNLFKHTSIPHYVWINTRSREVVAITENKDLVENNIEAFRRGKPLSFVLKKDESRKLKDNNDLFQPSIEIVDDDKTTHLQRLDDSSIYFRSVLTKYVDGLASGIAYGDSTYISVTNLTIWRLYQTALLGNSISTLNANSVVVEIPDSSLNYLVNGNSSNGRKLSSGLESLNWLKEYGYCYVLKVPPFLAQRKREIMLAELNSYFGTLYNIEGELAERKSKYLALVRTLKEDKLKSKEGINRISVDRLSLKLQNDDLTSLIAYLAVPLQKYPQIIDETGYTGRIDLDLNCQLADLSAVNKELEKYGLQLVEKEKLLTVAVIKVKK